MLYRPYSAEAKTFFGISAEGASTLMLDPRGLKGSHIQFRHNPLGDIRRQKRQTQSVEDSYWNCC